MYYLKQPSLSKNRPALNRIKSHCSRDRNHVHPPTSSDKCAYKITSVVNHYAMFYIRLCDNLSSSTVPKIPPLSKVTYAYIE